MTRVAVVGGGVIGLCCAYSLRKRGADVVVVEAAEVGGGASHGNAGWIVPSLSAPLPAPGLARSALRSMMRPDAPVYIRPRPALVGWLVRFWRHCNASDHAAGLHATSALARCTMDLYDAMERDGATGVVSRDGLLFVFGHAGAAASALGDLEPVGAYGYELPSRVLDRDELHTLEPALSEGATAGFLVERERHVDPAGLVRALATRVRELGVEIVERSPVSGFELAGDRVTALRTPDRRVEAGHVLLAAGAWTSSVARMLGSRLPVQAGKGYSFSVVPEVMPRRPIYLADAKIGCTPLGPRLRLAGTMELSGVNTRIDPRRVRAVARGAKRYLSGFDDTDLDDVWTGMRPVAPDGLPVLGTLPGWRNVTVATGHSMLGVTLGPATGEALAELVVTGHAPEVLRPFDPARFGRRR